MGTDKQTVRSKMASMKWNPGGRFKIICLQDLLENRQGDICFGLIGHGPTFCIRSKCNITHSGGKINLHSCSICVVKLNKTSLFCEPVVNCKRRSS
jgi:hypothetical protein